MFGYQVEHYTQADQLVMHNAPALTNEYDIGVRPVPVWEVLRENQHYPEDQGEDEDEDEKYLYGLEMDEITALTPEAAEQVQQIDDEFDQLARNNFLDDNVCLPMLHSHDTHTRSHAHACTHTHTYAHTLSHTHTHAHTRTRTHIHTRTHQGESTAMSVKELFTELGKDPDADSNEDEEVA